mgnify:CR=1 FL=1
MTHPHPELGPPPPLPEGGLRIVALGGLGEIGRNMTVFEIEGKLLVVDCGVLFPEEHQPGVDVILPDFAYIQSRLDDVVAIVLTHGHEDHIGAVPYLLRLKSDIPLIGSGLTLALVEAKLKEHRIKAFTLNVKEGQQERVGPFDLEFVAVNHSIPDALAVAIGTAHGQYKGEPKLDFERLKKIRELVNIPIVLHGSSGVPDEAITKAISLGVRKVNIVTNIREAFVDVGKTDFATRPLRVRAVSADAFSGRRARVA